MRPEDKVAVITGGGLVGPPNRSAYAVSKHGVMGFTKTLVADAAIFQATRKRTAHTMKLPVSQCLPARTLLTE